MGLCASVEKGRQVCLSISFDEKHGPFILLWGLTALPTMPENQNILQQISSDQDIPDKDDLGKRNLCGNQLVLWSTVI